MTNREEEEPQCPQVEEHRSSAVPPIHSGILDEDVQHNRVPDINRRTC